MAGNKVFFWIREKRAYIQKKLKKRHRGKLHFIVWDDEDLSEFGHGLYSHVRGSQIDSARLELRTSFPNGSTRVKL